jgi:hypothetical protein
MAGYVVNLVTTPGVYTLGTPAFPATSIESRASQPTSLVDAGSRRTVWNIIWGCLVTLFACIWVAVHPNIPGPHDTSLTIALRRVKVMVLALIAPELVILWAIRQWFVASRLAEKYRGLWVFVLQQSEGC